MCKAIDEMREDSRNEGRNEGREDARREMAIELLKENTFSLEKIAALTKLSIDTVEALQQEILQKA